MNSMENIMSALNSSIGKKVVVAEETGQLIGLACGIHKDGALLLDVDHQRRLIYSGDVSLRIEQSG